MRPTHVYLGHTDDWKEGKHMAFYFIPPDVHMREEIARYEEARAQERMADSLRVQGFQHEAEEARRASRGWRTTRTLVLVGGVIVVALLVGLYLHAR